MFIGFCLWSYRRPLQVVWLDRLRKQALPIFIPERYGVLYETYEPSRAWYFVWIHGEKMLFAMISVYDFNPQLQILLVHNQLLFCKLCHVITDMLL